MNRFTFITGMPRTRQAWLSAFLDGASEQVRTSFDQGFHDFVNNDSSLVKVSCGSGNLGNTDLINKLREDPNNEVRVIFIERDEKESLIALRRHLESFGIRMNYEESSKLFNEIIKSKNNFMRSVVIDSFFLYDEIDAQILKIAKLACDYQPTLDRIQLFQRLRISEIITPEQRSSLLQLIRGNSLSSDQEGQRILFDSEAARFDWSGSQGFSYGGSSDSRFPARSGYANSI